MGWLSWFTGGSKTAETVVDGAVKGLDAMFFTEEEKAEYRKKLGDVWLKAIEITRDESTVRSITRRFLAFAIIGEWLILVAVAVVSWWFDQEFTKFVFTVIGEQWGIVLAVVAFYFGPHMIGRAVKGAKDGSEN